MVIFGTGVVTGGLLVQHVQHGRDRRPPRPANTVRTAQPSTPGVMRFEFLRRMERELDLTPQQHEPIDRILQEGQERMKKLMETIEPHRREELKRTMEEFRGVLTPVQQIRFDELAKQQQQRSREQHKTAPQRERPANPPASTNSTPSSP
jgi:hypothetical protein